MQDVALNQYFKDLAPLKPLSRGDETELAEQIRRGSVRARDKLVLANLRFVVKVARGIVPGGPDQCGKSGTGYGC